jgi:hypothetical protein
MAKTMTIQLAVEEFELYDLYNDVIESYGQDLEDPSLVSDLYDLIDEYEEEYEFLPDSEGDFSDSFERNLRDCITTIVEENEDLEFIDEEFPDDDDIPEAYDGEFDDESEDMGVELDDTDDTEESDDFY